MSQNQDPREKHPKPPFPKQPQKHPGHETLMDPRPDHGTETYQGCNKLKDRAAVITGGDSGIGAAVAIHFAKEGADVVISYLNEEKDAQNVVQQVEKLGRKAIAIPGDIQDESHCIDIIEQTKEKLGKIDILVNNAAYQMSFNSIEEFTEEEIDKTFRTNIYAMFYLVKAASKYMQPGSAIINTASIQAYDPTPQLMAYACTKAAIVNFTKSIAQHLGEKGIRANAVAPGPIWTPLIPYSMPEEKVSTFGQDTTIGRPAQPSEVAPVYIFLASEDSSYVTGHVYGVTGGRGWP